MHIEWLGQRKRIERGGKKRTNAPFRTMRMVNYSDERIRWNMFHRWCVATITATTKTESDRKKLSRNAHKIQQSNVVIVNIHLFFDGVHFTPEPQLKCGHPFSTATHNENLWTALFVWPSLLRCARRKISYFLIWLVLNLSSNWATKFINQFCFIAAFFAHFQLHLRRAVSFAI